MKVIRVEKFLGPNDESDLDPENQLVACGTNPLNTDSFCQTFNVTQLREITVDRGTFTCCMVNAITFGEDSVTSLSDPDYIYVIDHDMDECLDPAFYFDPNGVR